MKAIILAAGMGTRLGKYTQSLPKCMLEFRGKTLLQRQVDTLRSCGITDITIIKGYEPDKIKIEGVKYFENKDYGSTNMVETLFCAREELQGEVLVCYADIIYQQSVINKILSTPVDIGVTIDDDYWEYWQARLDNPQEDVESMVVKEGKIIDLGDTSCDMDKAKLRYVGIIKFSAQGIDSLKKVYDQNRSQFFDLDQPWKRSKSFKKAYMTCMLQALIDEGYSVKPIYITHGWMEFDTIEDYERAIAWVQEGSLHRFIDLEK